MSDTGKRWMTLGASLALIALILGAFGSHALKNVLTASQLLTFEIGVRYQMYHALALLLIALVAEQHASRWWVWSRRLILIGILLFSGSLYLLAIVGAGWWAPVTPLGGLCMMTGWGAFMIGIWQRSGNDK